MSPAPAVLAVSDLTVAGDRRHVAVDAVTLEVRAGEVVGIAGVSGNGQRELADAIAGLRPVVSGTVMDQRGRDDEQLAA